VKEIAEAEGVEHRQIGRGKTFQNALVSTTRFFFYLETIQAHFLFPCPRKAKKKKTLQFPQA